MSVLNSVLRYTPSNWKRDTYNDHIYIKVGLHQQCEEYREIERTICATNNNIIVTKIQRIQHPFAFGRFHIRKQQLALIHEGEFEVKTVILLITDVRKIHTIIRYNCDARRGGFREQHSNYPNHDGFLLILQRLGCNEIRDGNQYPEYLIGYSTKTQNRTYRPAPTRRFLPNTAPLENQVQTIDEVSRRFTQISIQRSSVSGNTRTVPQPNLFHSSSSQSVNMGISRPLAQRSIQTSSVSSNTRIAPQPNRAHSSAHYNTIRNQDFLYRQDTPQRNYDENVRRTSAGDTCIIL